jgi:hypothetical protein
LGQLGDLVIKLAPRFAFPIRTGQSSEAARGRFIPVRGNEKSIILTIPVIRSVGGDSTPERFEVDSQISDDLIRQERHQIGITRKPRIVFGKRLHAGSGPAELVMSFEQEHGFSSLGEVARRDQSVVAATDNDGIVYVAVLLHYLANPLSDPATAGFFGFNERFWNRVSKPGQLVSVRGRSEHSADCF